MLEISGSQAQSHGRPLEQHIQAFAHQFVDYGFGDRHNYISCQYQPSEGARIII